MILVPLLSLGLVPEDIKRKKTGNRSVTNESFAHVIFYEKTDVGMFNEFLQNTYPHQTPGLYSRFQHCKVCLSAQ